MTFDEAYRAHRTRLTRYATRWCLGTGIDPEDLVQETMVHAWRIWDKYEKRNEFTWLATICKNKLHRMRRDARREMRGGGAAHVEWDENSDTRSTPATQEMAIFANQLQSKFAGFGAIQEQLLVGAMHGETPTEIALKRGVSVNAATKSLRQARAKLQQFV